MSIQLLRKVKDMPCVICKKVVGLQSYPIHVIPRRHGGPTEKWNIMPMCADHHIQWHILFPHRMCTVFPEVMEEIKKRGFYFESLNLKHPTLEKEKEEIKKKLESKPKKRKDGSTYYE